MEDLAEAGLDLGHGGVGQRLADDTEGGRPKTGELPGGILADAVGGIAELFDEPAGPLDDRLGPFQVAVQRDAHADSRSGLGIDRQREVVLLYFIEELNQRQIAERLGIAQQSVSEHLYGKIRNGRAVGGALRKLRKACATQGLWLNG